MFRTQPQKIVKLVPASLGERKHVVLKNAVCVSSEHKTKDTTYLAKLTSHARKNPVTVYYPVIFDEKVPNSELQLSKTMREFLKFNISTDLNKPASATSVEFIPLESHAPPVIATQVKVEIQQMIAPKSCQLDTEILTDSFKKTLSSYPLTTGQSLLIPYEEKDHLELVVTKINDGVEPSTIYQLDEKSQISFSIAPHAKNLSFPFVLDFKAKGIGGHKEELEQLIREAFYSRALGNEFSSAYGTQHTKGILLYGPPGTGKTLIAREIGKLFSKDNIKVVNGPELKNKFVGQSQENLRNIFGPAIEEWKREGVKSKLHVIIIDEIDALVPRRGSHTSGAGVDDDMVAQFLTILDGVDSPKNILVIGMTNRKDLVDPAVLRPGRLSAHIEIGLPKEEARFEILSIKTDVMNKSGLLDASVDLKYWAKETENFTGAELEELVIKATHHAMRNNFADGKLELVVRRDLKSVAQLEKVTQDHFKQAFSEITPAFGVNQHNFQLKRENFVAHNSELQEVFQNFDNSLSALRKNKNLHSLQFLISGDDGVGKTELAKNLAAFSRAKYIKVISPEHLLGLSLSQQLDLLDEEFDKAAHSEVSVIILDELENLLEADANLHNYNNRLRLKLAALLKNANDSENKIIILATTKDVNFIKQMQLFNLFNESLILNNVKLKYSNEEDLKSLATIGRLLGYQMVMKKKPTIDDTRSIHLSIRELIYKLKKFCSDETNNNQFDADEFFDFVNHSRNVSAKALTTSALSRDSLFSGSKERKDEHNTPRFS